ncbi:hypothetical protein KCV87_11990 [Actinosynnema pretiosum subsp. pretiosum]|uniref:Uncharacterized protein n=1 Tax=Actinosynnema pretiosum subsp. pretiosum TaxID=103721 RepID=A0AA45LCC3_9PSEU|nr:hypothetical protein APASM_1647 [Actinosynnema pretiosum subsp. pretiosum]QUF06700.1 hypothetical protein KCV87_11990 [Actinosynnema pretiosum subsp. pretiosum]
MIKNVGALVAELKALRKGRGLDAPDLAARVGPGLRSAFDLDVDARPDRLREEVAERLRKLAGTLAPDQRDAVLVVYGLTPESAATRFYKERVTMLATGMDRDDRTAGRFIDKVLDLVARAALAPPSAPGGTCEDEAALPWRLTSLRTSVVLNEERPKVYETRRLLLMRDRIDRIDLDLSVPVTPAGVPPGDGFQFHVLHGATLQEEVRRSSTRRGYSLRLPRALPRQSEHEVFLRFTFPGHGAMWPFYVSTPALRCEHFDLRVKFPENRVPERVWRVAGVLPLEVQDPLAARESIEPDANGEVHSTFTGLVPNLSYGVVWSHEPAGRPGAGS